MPDNYLRVLYHITSLCSFSEKMSPIIQTLALNTGDMVLRRPGLKCRYIIISLKIVQLYTLTVLKDSCFDLFFLPLYSTFSKERGNTSNTPPNLYR